MGTVAHEILVPAKKPNSSFPFLDLGLGLGLGLRLVNTSTGHFHFSPSFDPELGEV